MDWLDILAVQGTLKILLQHHNSKVSILQCSAFLIVQLSHPYILADTFLQIPSKCSKNSWQRGVLLVFMWFQCPPGYVGQFDSNSEF